MYSHGFREERGRKDPCLQNGPQMGAGCYLLCLLPFPLPLLLPLPLSLPLLLLLLLFYASQAGYPLLTESGLPDLGFIVSLLDLLFPY